MVSKDPKALIPDGEIFLARDSIFFDVSGVHSLAPSHFRPHAPQGSAVAGRETHKETKYAEYATERHARIVPFVLDCFGTVLAPWGSAPLVLSTSLTMKGIRRASARTGSHDQTALSVHSLAEVADGQCPRS